MKYHLPFPVLRIQRPMYWRTENKIEKCNNLERNLIDSDNHKPHCHRCSFFAGLKLILNPSQPSLFHMLEAKFYLLWSTSKSKCQFLPGQGPQERRGKSCWQNLDRVMGLLSNQGSVPSRPYIFLTVSPWLCHWGDVQIFVNFK